MNRLTTFMTVLFFFGVTSAYECRAEEPDSTVVAQTTGFKPRTDFSTDEIRRCIDSVKPYTLYQPGVTATYIKEYNGRRSDFLEKLVHLTETVERASVEDGTLAVYVNVSFLDKKGKPSKYGGKRTFKTLIDPQGNYHFTHNPAADALRMIKERKGFGLLIGGQMEKGHQPPCGKMVDKVSVFGSARYYTTEYSGWEVLGEGQLTTPAGTFDCLKLSGYVSRGDDKTQITCWMARGIGIIRYDIDDGSVKYVLESIENYSNY